MRADTPHQDFRIDEDAPAEETAGAFFHHERAQDAVPEEPDVMAPSEKYQLTKPS